MPLIEHLHADEAANIKMAVAANNERAILSIFNEAAWRRLAVIWNDVLIKFWILKTWRVRDLRWLWVRLFGEPPVDLMI